VTRFIASRKLAWRSASASPTLNDDVLPRWGVPEWFLISQTAIPALLLIPGSQMVRLPLRIAPFAVSLVALAWWQWKRSKIAPHPARPWLLLAVAYLWLMIFHPTTNTLLAGLAHVMLYLSVMAPIFWVPTLIRGPHHLARLLGILLVCNGINSMVGVMQAYDPVRWMPEELSLVITMSEYGLDAVSYVGPAGRLIIRPPGLFDNPGAVSGPGMVAALLGLVFCLGPIVAWRKAIAGAFALAGMAAIYLSHVRTSFVIVAGMALVYCGMFIVQKRRTKATLLLFLAVLLVSAALLFAVLVGGESITQRFATLFEDDPITVYYNTKRGEQLEYAFRILLFEYPLGAGLGRWGMMHQYFGDPSSLSSPPVWAELQPNAWILDGGFALMILYCIALVVTAAYELRVAKWVENPSLRFLAAAIVAANAGTLALVFGFTPFTTQIGMQYWFLAGALHGAARGSAQFPFSRSKRQARLAPPVRRSGVAPMT